MNKFKKSTLTTATALILCFTTLVITAFAATQNLSAYETLKGSLIDLTSLDNATITGSVKLLDNGNEIISAGLDAKIEDANTSNSKLSVMIDNKTFTEEHWSDSTQSVSKSSESDKYRVTKYFMPDTKTSRDNYVTTFESEDGVVYSYNTVKVGGSEQGFDSLSKSEQKLVNAAIDLFVGDIKNYFTTSGNTISLNLQKDQIPQIIQLFVSVMAEKSTEVHNSNYTITMANENSIKYHDDDSDDIFKLLPKFTDDTTIKSGNLNVTLDDNKNISSIKGTAEVTCTDVNGIAHTLTFEVDLDISNIGSTVADMIDLTDKAVDTFEPYRFNPTITVYQADIEDELNETDDNN